ncbi:MAG: ATP-dependent DNA helicase RecG [Rhodothermaceae bacterium]|nr:ATP-dependent DNA helicase RecG [Rhodothermaceae bacterium]MXW31764.1 ATP-dependent DNA helicase RecG [Rhodothermaceae bacterium]MYC03209.1 ATP-dependent DNA helicase RecG [Rhodothermaceae bacterium]MYE62942.1 ATP-dependent DNA helicase RecG [Rhodothermaceae bacterium]MYI16885.1 ATP-dependent DNA helicase RecG [Rhodothermaceae bacterium]
MTKVELRELIINGENSLVEFKRDDVHPMSLAKEMSALLNREGGVILLGVEDNGEISGISASRRSTEEWVMNIALNSIQPSTDPAFLPIKIDDDNSVGIIKLSPDTSSKPYRARKNNAWVTYVRVGSTSREATREEEVRLYQTAGLVNYETRPVRNTGLDSLDLQRVVNYFQFILEIPAPPYDEIQEWEQILLNSDLLIETDDGNCVSAAGLLLFGKNPNRRLPQAGVTAVVFPGTEKDYNTIDEEIIRGPVVPLFAENRSVIGSGVIDRATEFVKRNMDSVAWLEGARRQLKKAFPIDAVREAIINAVTHRDYTREGTDIEISMYKDRLEIISPGDLPNGVTVEKMRRGVVRVTRNEILKQVLRDCRYIEHFGLGVRKRIIQSMWEHNGTEPDLIEEEDRFKVILWKSRDWSENDNRS